MNEPADGEALLAARKREGEAELEQAPGQALLGDELGDALGQEVEQLRESRPTRVVRGFLGRHTGSVGSDWLEIFLKIFNGLGWVVGRKNVDIETSGGFRGRKGGGSAPPPRRPLAPHEEGDSNKDRHCRHNFIRLAHIATSMLTQWSR